MNKAKVFAFALVLLLTPSIGICESDGWTGNINAYIGKKYLDSDDWEPADEQLLLGISLDVRPIKWPFNIAFGFFDSRDDVSEPEPGFLFPGTKTIFRSNITEIDIGIRKIWERSPTVRPYIGGGVALISGEVRRQDRGSQKDDDKGYWINAGFYWTIGGSNYGFDFKYSVADIALFGEDIDAGGFSAAVILGFHW